ncbi:unnamed protein product [Adineta steineri]|uniref:EF-hand domain-containing protein n=1 Tax=Adineta steineri TaxID=433720 RepID=A0A813PJ30_9BILA|nr:unnamed protein product [Adineta steineri]CAF3846603.1 unnamed protein product [Adineta steineri]
MGNRIVTKFGKSKSLTDEEIVLIQKISKLSADEIREEHKGFMKLQPTGKMTKRQFINMYNLLDFDCDMTDKVACNKAFATFDKNKNGTIEFDEFLFAMHFLRTNTIESNVDILFRGFDISGDGYLDHEEVTGIFDGAIALNLVQDADPDYARKTASEVFTILGLSDDSKINKEQLIKGCKEHPNLLKKLYLEK